MASTSNTNQNIWDRFVPFMPERLEFDLSQRGVKGLVDREIAVLPTMFRHPPAVLMNHVEPIDDNGNLIPTIDLADPHDLTVQRIYDASREVGFFRIINHGVPNISINNIISSVKGFHGESESTKIVWYNRDFETDYLRGTHFLSNIDLFESRAACWHDMLQIRLDPLTTVMPEMCRPAVMDWTPRVKQLGNEIIGYLSEGLGLHRDRLRGPNYMGRVGMIGKYYPACPEPEQTFGLASHSDPGMFSLIVANQNNTALQVKYRDAWVNLKYIPNSI